MSRLPQNPPRRRLHQMLLQTLLLGALALGAGCAPKPVVDAPPKSVVFFTAFSANLDSDAQQVVEHVSADALANPRRTIYVEGYADQVGTASANRTLSDLRAQVVADAIVGHGVPRSRLVVRPRGATAADPGIESRRVDVSFGS